MPFAVVSVVGRGMGVLDEGPLVSRGRGGFKGFRPIGLNGVFWNRNLQKFDSGFTKNHA